MKTIATIEARMTSSRLPGKVLLPVLGRPLLDLMIERVQRCARIDQVVVATTTNAEDDAVEAVATARGAGCFRGSEQDVMVRVLGAAEAFEADLIVELTGDCPLIDPAIVDAVVDHHHATGADYTSNVHAGDRYPLGMAVEVFPTRLLAAAAAGPTVPEDREHVSTVFYRDPTRYRLAYHAAPASLTDPTLRLTVDEAPDFDLIRSIFERLHNADPAFDLERILRLLRAEPDLRRINAHIEQRVVEL